jgi:WD40 repeat protein
LIRGYEFGKIARLPVALNETEFAYIGEKLTKKINVYNFIENKKSTPFVIEECEGENSPIISYIKYNNNMLSISGENKNEIRIWDIATRFCKRILNPLLPCTKLIPLGDSFISITSDEVYPKPSSFIQIWKMKELDLYPVLFCNDYVYDVVVMNRSIIAILTQGGIEIWNLPSRRRIRGYFDEGLTLIYRINSFVFVCNDCNYEDRGEFLYLYDYRERQRIEEIDKGYLSDVMINIDGRYIAYESDDNKICIYDTKYLKEEKTIDALDGKCYFKGKSIFSQREDNGNSSNKDIKLYYKPLALASSELSIIRYNY